MNSSKVEYFIRSAKAPVTRAGVMIAKVSWYAIQRNSGMLRSVDQQAPQADEQQQGRVLHPLGEGAGHQGGRDDREGELVRDPEELRHAPICRPAGSTGR